MCLRETLSLGRKTREGGDVGGGEKKGGGSEGAHRASRLRVARRGRECHERERHERYGLEEGAEEHVVVEGVGREVEGELFRAEARGKVRLGRVSPRSTSKSTRTTPRRPHRAVRGPPPRGTLDAADRTRPEASRALPCVRIDDSERNEREGTWRHFGKHLETDQ